VFEIIRSRAVREEKSTEIPGWVQSERALMTGKVVNLSGARPAGSGG